MKREILKDNFQLLQSEKEKLFSLVIAGAGYHTDLPLLYFASRLLGGYGAVLQVQKSIVTMEDIEEVFFAEKERHKHKRLVLLGKSAGASKIQRLCQKHTSLASASLFLLTPLLNKDSMFTFLQNSSQEVYIFIGDKDKHYNPERIALLRQKPNVRVFVYPEATHSLEYKAKENVFLSLEILDKIMAEVANAIQK
jgi:hypothetical protein